VISGNGSGDKWGALNSIDNSSNSVHMGTQNILSGSGTGAHYGTYNSHTGTSDGEHFGTYNAMGGSGNGIQYGSYQLINNTGFQDQYGVYNNLNNNSSGQRFGTYNRLNGSDSFGIGSKYATYNEIAITGDAPHYGSYTVLSGTGAGNKTGYFADLSGATGGTHFGIYTNVPIANGYAAYFNGNLLMTAGRAEFVTNTDATPSSGSGVLEIGSNLRIDNNEIITNTGNTLFLQHDNVGDLRVDDTTLMVDASANRVGIGTLIPGYALDVVGDINTSGNIRQTGGAYNFPDYVFESYFSGGSSYKPDYKLKDLNEITAFLKEHHHLPGVQSRDDVEKEGWNVSQNVLSNLEKIEELFLYLIETQKEMASLKAQNEALKLRLELLEKNVSN
nr:hypothetical protein [Flavobacteriaceae bacterium]